MRPPMRVAQGLIILSVNAPPRGERRRRYERELLAELFAMSDGQRRSGPVRRLEPWPSRIRMPNVWPPFRSSVAKRTC